jgi:negative regulator of sigma E activity
MSQPVEEQLSAFLDGELPSEELDLLLARLDREPAKRATLARYAMAGECIRSGSASVSALEVAERVRAALLAEQERPFERIRARPAAWRGWAAGGVAAAAAVVALALVSPGTFQSVPAPSATPAATVATVADEPLTDIRPAVNRRLTPRAAARLTGYLVAHGQYTNQLSRSNFDSHLISARAERASWRRPQDAGYVR